MENLFAYGTLMCEDIMQKVSGLELFSVQAILSDFQKYLIKDHRTVGILVPYNPKES